MRLELRHVRKSFGKRQALAGVDLTIASGARVALLGPNGSGKTTLTRAIMGLVEHEGEILVDGKPLRTGPELAARLAYVPQVTPQIGATVDEIVRIVTGLRGVSRGVVVELAAELGLELDRVRHQPVRGLSGGMRQKLFIALALAAPAELLVLDEPTASLDAAARARVLARVGAIRNVTLVLCSHRLDELRALVDHVVALDDGKVAYDGPAAVYLAARQEAVIELRHRGDAADWLAANGFARGTGDWWTRAVSHAEKLELLPAALARIGGALDDVVIRETDRVDLEARHA
ncbi:MAG: ABC transporter ATP-binding protein [Deltaproteobacteria bacterium]|nr:ABC transporter ATP-binding protein [Kofleriaceae bacterium]